MRFLLVVLLIPLVLIPVAAVGLHVMACDMRLTSVDAMRDQRAGSERQRWFYGYCKFMAARLGDTQAR